MAKKQGVITEEEFAKDRERAIRLANECKREERYIRIDNKNIIGVPSHLSDLEVQARIERFMQRNGLSKVRVA